MGLRLGLLFCLRLFPLSGLCGHNISSAPFSAYFYVDIKCNPPTHGVTQQGYSLKLLTLIETHLS